MTEILMGNFWALAKKKLNTEELKCRLISVNSRERQVCQLSELVWFVIFLGRFFLLLTRSVHSVDQFLDLFSHRFFYVLLLFLSVLVIPTCGSSLVNFWAHYKIVMDWLINWLIIQWCNFWGFLLTGHCEFWTDSECWWMETAAIRH